MQSPTTGQTKYNISLCPSIISSLKGSLPLLTGEQIIHKSPPSPAQSLIHSSHSSYESWTTPRAYPFYSKEQLVAVRSLRCNPSARFLLIKSWKRLWNRPNEKLQRDTPEQQPWITNAKSRRRFLSTMVASRNMDERPESELGMVFWLASSKTCLCTITFG